MRVLLDCDGVLADLTNYFLAWLELRHDGVKRTAEQCVNFGWVDSFGIPQHVEDRFFAEVSYARHCERVPAYPGARAFVARLQAKHDVWACTATSGAAWTGQRAEWLERVVGIEARQQIICGKKAKAFIQADALIDDSLQNCEAWAQEHPEGLSICFKQPWNERHDFNWIRSRHLRGYEAVLRELGA